jgi:hypothetical protein
MSDVDFEIEIESIPTKTNPPRPTAHRRACVPGGIAGGRGGCIARTLLEALVVR